MTADRSFQQRSPLGRLGTAVAVLALHILAAQMFLAAQHRIAPHIDDNGPPTWITLPLIPQPLPATTVRAPAAAAPVIPSRGALNLRLRPPTAVSSAAESSDTAVKDFALCSLPDEVEHSPELRERCAKMIGQLYKGPPGEHVPTKQELALAAKFARDKAREDALPLAPCASPMGIALLYSGLCLLGLASGLMTLDDVPSYADVPTDAPRGTHLPSLGAAGPARGHR